MSLSYVVELPSLRAHLPKHVQIAEAVADDIARGRLPAGAKLPGSRRLAQQLGVHRNTVNAALAELSAQGWVEAAPARGVFVKALTPLERPRKLAPRSALRGSIPETPGFALPASPLPARPLAARDPKSLLLVGGVADARLFPVELLARTYRRVVMRHGQRMLDYAAPYGAPPLREALARMLSRTRGLAAKPHNVLVTRGSQHAIWLLAHTLIAPGDRVGVEALGYPPAWQALRSAGARLVPLALDAEGVRVDAVERALAEGPLRALYLTPHHQYPTMVPLSPARRVALLQLAQRHRIALLEDDYTHEFQYEGRPRLPLASADPSGCVSYIGTLSKVLAPGLRVGYVVAPEALVERMAAQRAFLDRQGDGVAELVAAELIEDGELARHVRRMRGIYQARRAVLVDALQRQLGDRLTFTLPQGGMNLWIRVHGGSADPWAARARARGVLFRPGSELSLEGRTLPFVRMGFTALDERELVRAVRVAAQVFAGPGSERVA